MNTDHEDSLSSCHNFIINYVHLLDYLENLIFEDEVESIRREVEGFLSAGVNKIIVVGHGGFLLDQKIAREVEGIDVIVGGHSNTFLYTGSIFFIHNFSKIHYISNEFSLHNFFR